MSVAVSLAPFRSTKAAVKLHTLHDLRGNIPAFIHISDGRLHDVNILDPLLPEIGVFYFMDRDYLDFSRLHVMNQIGSYFVLRAKSNTKYQRIYSRKVDRSTDVVCDKTVKLWDTNSTDKFPDALRRISFKDLERNKKLVFLTNNTQLSALILAELYKSRWQVELFFKWVKQHLRINSFYVVSENAAKSQLWIAVSVYVLCAIIKKLLHLEQTLFTILQILSLTQFARQSFETVWYRDRAFGMTASGV